MKAIVCTKYGPPDVLELQELEKPIPKDNEVLIRVRAATVTAGDCEIRRFDLPVLFWLPLRIYLGIRKPRINVLGQELAGEIESVGKNVKQFRKGDQVFSATTARFGAYAEYICLPDKIPMLKKSGNMSYDEAATIPTGGFNALDFLRRGNARSGQKILIYGAAGSIGTLAVQIAKTFGAEVTAVDSTAKLDTLLAIGADRVIDYTKEDFTGNGETYDLIVDVVGRSPFSGSLKSLSEDGCYVIGNPGLLHMIRGLWASVSGGKKVINALAKYRIEDLQFLKELIETGKIKAVIDRRYPLERLAEAHRYVETGEKTGNVVITVGQNDAP